MVEQQNGYMLVAGKSTVTGFHPGLIVWRGAAQQLSTPICTGGGGGGLGIL